MSESSWIKMRCNLATDPAVVEIAAAVGVDEFGVVGRLHTVWSWLDQHSVDGTNVRITSAFLDRLTACPGFADAMRTVSWLSGRDGALEFPGYCKHNGPTAKSRATETRRKADQRERDRRPVDPLDNRPVRVGTSVPVLAGLEKRRVDKNHVVVSDPTTPPAEKKALGADPTADDEAWIESLAEDPRYAGIDVRAEIGKAQAYCARKSKRMEREWFRVEWLDKCSPEVGAAKRRATQQPPAGWQEWVAERYPEADAVEAFGKLPRDVQRECREALNGNNGKAA
jgi:hypothetical protein